MARFESSGVFSDSDNLESDAESTAVDDEKWTAGDFEIRSADGVRFLVPSCFVLASR